MLRVIHQEIGSLRDENQKQNTKIAHLEEVIESQENRIDDKITKESDHRMMEVLAHAALTLLRKVKSDRNDLIDYSH